MCCIKYNDSRLRLNESNKNITYENKYINGLT